MSNVRRHEELPPCRGAQQFAAAASRVEPLQTAQSTDTVRPSSYQKRSSNGYQSHRNQSGKQVFERAFEYIDEQDFKIRSGQHALPGFSIQGHFRQGGDRRIGCSPRR